jgi:hypothetical protein
MLGVAWLSYATCTPIGRCPAHRRVRHRRLP